MALLENPRHELFTRALIKHGGHQTKAYLEVYPNSKYASARHSASLLLTNVYIKRRLNELLAQNGLGIAECIQKLRALTEAEKFLHYKDGAPVMLPDNFIRFQAVQAAIKIHVMLGNAQDFSENKNPKEV